MTKTLTLLLTGVMAVTAMSMSVSGQGPSSQAEQFLAPYGLDQFPELYRKALDTLLTAEDHYWSADYAGAFQVLEQLWTQNPPGSAEWGQASKTLAGINIGLPPCYYALRMLTDCVRWRLEQVGQQSSQGEPDKVTLTVVLVGGAKGIQPTCWDELIQHTGRELETTLHPLLLQDDYRVIHQSLRLFNEYILAMTKGRLGVRTNVLHLPDLCIPVQTSLGGRTCFSTPAPDAWSQIWAAIPSDVRDSTDWWWVLYPSHLATPFAEAQNKDIITGGMTWGPGGSPCFHIDDLWLVRKPAHLGAGLYSDVERRAYLPQWLQHEFFHHLFIKCCPEFKLEATGHQWFDRKTWPEDFQGRYEADYYYEALHKRMQGVTDPPLHVRLRCAPPPRALFRNIPLAALLGNYRHQPVENDWHIVTVTVDEEASAEGKPVLRWTNKARVSWRLWPDLEKGILRAGDDCPYGTGEVTIVLRRDENGKYVPEVAGLEYSGFYALESK